MLKTPRKQCTRARGAGKSTFKHPKLHGAKKLNLHADWSECITRFVSGRIMLPVWGVGYEKV
jgi:hypothetical protein